MTADATAGAGADPRPRVAVVGAGVTGLSLVHHLRARGVPAVCFEAASEPGGVIRSDRLDGRVVERGPQRIRMTDPVADLVEAVGLGEELVVADDDAPLFVYRDGRLRVVPRSPGEFLRTDLLSWRGKLRVLAEPLTADLDPEERASEAFRRKFGDEAYRAVIRPLFGGIYASDPAEMPVRHALSGLLRLEAKEGSLLRPALGRARGGTDAAPVSFEGGLQRLPAALAADHDDAVRLDTPVERILPVEGGAGGGGADGDAGVAGEGGGPGDAGVAPGGEDDSGVAPGGDAGPAGADADGPGEDAGGPDGGADRGPGVDTGDGEDARPRRDGGARSRSASGSGGDVASGPGDGGASEPADGAGTPAEDPGNGAETPAEDPGDGAGTAGGDPTPRYRVVLGGDDGEGTAGPFEHVVLTAAAPDAAAVLEGVASDAARRLRELTYNPIAMVYLDSACDRRGFGYQVVHGEGLRTRGVTFNASLFDRERLYTAFLGGMEDPEVVEYPDDELGSLAAREFEAVTGASADPVGVNRVTAYPAYDTSWSALDGLDLPAGLHLATNYTARIGVPSRVREARRLAGELAGDGD